MYKVPSKEAVAKIKPLSQVICYAKGWYVTDKTTVDLRKLIAPAILMNPEDLSTADVEFWLLSITIPLLDLSKDADNIAFILNIWQHGVIEQCLRTLRYAGAEVFELDGKCWLADATGEHLPLKCNCP